MTEKEDLPLHQSVLADLWRFFFRLLYFRFAWIYYIYAAGVSLGMWNEWILTTIPYLAGDKILELGHGTGILQVELQSKEKNVIGIDASRQMGQQAFTRLKRHGYNPTLITALAQYLPFPDTYFQQVVATFPSEFIIDGRTLIEIHRVLQPRGELIILPYAWITGQQWHERLAAWLFRVTGQAPEWDEKFNQPFEMMGFTISVERIVLGSSNLPLLFATRQENNKKMS